MFSPESSPKSRVESRIAELGYSLPEVAAPVAAYVPAVQLDNLVYTSGQLPVVAGKLPATGQLSADSSGVPAEEGARLAGICALNALAAIKNVIGDLDRITRIVKLVGFVSSTPDFSGQPAVINGASQLLREIFGEKGEHARSAVGVASLPLGAPVEVELIVAFK